METWGVVFLGIIALGSLVQIAVLILAAVHGRRLARRVDELQTRLEGEVQPAIENLRQATQNVAEISERAVEQARRVDSSVTDALTRIDDTIEGLRSLVRQPPGLLGDLIALAKGVRRGFEVYHRLRGADEKRGGRSRSYTDDEHLFI